MVYRKSELRNRCRVCTTTTSHACRNCAAPTCSAHLLDGSCSVCSVELYEIENRLVQRAGRLYAALAIPLAGACVALGFSGATASIGFPALLALLLGYGATPGIVRPWIRRRLAHKRLAPRALPRPTQRNLLPEAGAATDDRRYKDRYRIRTRPGVTRAPRPVVVGRGLTFK